jgi:hypothetical protein
MSWRRWVAEIRMWWLEPGITHWLASTSLWNTTCPVSGHLIQRLSGVSRLKSVLIFGRTTSEIQFIALILSSWPGSSGHPRLSAPVARQAAARFVTERTPSLNSFTNVVTASTVCEVARSSGRDCP